MLCLLALNLRLPGFYFNAGDFQPYSTLRYLGTLDGGHSLPEENVHYRDIDLDAPDFTLDPKAGFTLRGTVCLGFRQLDNDRWPASPLYDLSITDHDLARRVAGGKALRIKLAVTGGGTPSGPERFAIAEAVLDDGRRVPSHHLRLTLNTLGRNGSGTTYYWIDSGSVFKK